MKRHLDVVPAAADVDLRLAVENHFLPAARVFRLHVEIVDLERGVGAGAGEAHHVVLAVVHLHGHLAEAVVVRPDVVRRVQMAVHLSSSAFVTRDSNVRRGKCHQSELEEVVGRRARHPDQLGVLLHRHEAERHDVAARVRPLAFRVAVHENAVLRAELERHGVCSVNEQSVTRTNGHLNETLALAAGHDERTGHESVQSRVR